MQLLKKSSDSIEYFQISYIITFWMLKVVSPLYII